MASNKALGCPRSIPGPTHPKNKDALDWGGNSFIAYGCASNVVLVDPYSGQVIQMLVGGHKAPVTKCKVRSQAPSVTPQVQLVSGDDAGCIILWNALSGKAEVELEDRSKSTLKALAKPVVDLAWITDGTGDSHVLSLHAGAQLTMWDVDHGEILWTLSTTDNIQSFALDGFNASRMCMVTEELLIVVDDLSPDQAPADLNNRFNVSGPALGKAKPTKETTALTAYFSPLDRDLLFLMFPREVLIMDLRTNQTIGQLLLERSGSPFQQIIPCSTVSMVYCLHKNGCISARWRSRDIGSSYEFIGQSDTLRLHKTSSIMTMGLNPMDDSAPALLTSDGKILFYKFNAPAVLASSDTIYDHNTTINKIHSNSFLLDQIVESIVSPIVCMKMCPERLRTINQYGDGPTASLAAIGTSTGYIQIFDTSTCNLKRQFFVSSSNIRGVDWAAHSIVCFCSDGNSMATPTYRNLVFQIDLRNGVIKRILDTADHPSPIAAVKISDLGQYLIILFHDQPFELWDLPNATLLKVMPTSFPRVAGLVWSVNGLRKKGSQRDEVVEPVANPAKSTSTKMSREHLVVTTHEGHILHFTVEGSVVRYGARIPTDPIMGAVTCLAWKGDWIVTGDSAGGLHFWDLKAKLSRSIMTNHSAVKDIVFLPKKGSTRFFALFSDGVGVWDAATADVIASKAEETPDKEITAVSIGWSSFGSPVVAYAEGLVHIYDVWLSSSTSAISNCNYARPIQLIAASNNKIVQYAKSYMQYEQCADLRTNETTPLVPDGSEAASENAPSQIEAAALRSVQCLPTQYYTALVKASSISERCLLTARIFGDNYEYRFWMLFRHYAKMQSAFDLLPSSPKTAADVRKTAQSTARQGGQAAIPPPYQPEELPENDLLPASFDILCDASEIRRQQLQRLKMQSGNSGKEKNKCIQQHVLLGQHSNAVQMLLETDAKEETFYEDSLRACIVSAVGSPDTCQNTIKLVAMNLIAAGKLDSGVELLCLVGCHLDACSYLQSEGQWQRAAHLAKATLHPAAYSEVLSRWVEHLQTSKLKSEAVLVCLSYGQWKRALAFLNSMNTPNLTVLYAEACLQEGLLTIDDSGGPERRHGNTISARGALLQTVWMKAAKVAAMVGNRTLMQRYNLKFDATDGSSRA